MRVGGISFYFAEKWFKTFFKIKIELRSLEVSQTPRRVCSELSTASVVWDLSPPEQCNPEEKTPSKCNMFPAFLRYGNAHLLFSFHRVFCYFCSHFERTLMQPSSPWAIVH